MTDLALCSQPLTVSKLAADPARFVAIICDHANEIHRNE
jgi:hypothetical protein